MGHSRSGGNTPSGKSLSTIDKELQESRLIKLPKTSKQIGTVYKKNGKNLSERHSSKKEIL